MAEPDQVVGDVWSLAVVIFVLFQRMRLISLDGLVASYTAQSNSSESSVVTWPESLVRRKRTRGGVLELPVRVNVTLLR